LEGCSEEGTGNYAAGVPADSAENGTRDGAADGANNNRTADSVDGCAENYIGDSAR
jgi:hypothetical protein